MSDFEKAWKVVKIEKEELPPEAPFHSTEEKRLNEQTPDYPIEYEDPCPHCGASTEANPVINDRFQGSLSHPDNSTGAYKEHEIIDYGLDGDYYQTYKCFNCSGEWENRYSFSGIVLRDIV